MGEVERLGGKDKVEIVGATLALPVAEGEKVGEEGRCEGLIVDGISAS